MWEGCGMKECWINVYKFKEKVWYGPEHDFRWRAEAMANKYLIYRIHVRLK